MDFNNIVLMFQQLSGCDVTQINENLPIIANAVNGLSNLIDFEKCTPQKIAGCEYACAVCSVYDFVLKESAREKIVTTIDGKSSASIDYSKRIDGAKQLKIVALSAIRDVLLDNDFLFMNI